MKLLLVSRSLFPCYKGGSAFVTESLAGGFSKDNLVVAGGKFFLGEDTEIDRPPQGPKFIYLPTEIHIRNRGHKYFKFLRWLFVFPVLVFALRRIMRREKCTYVIATFPDNLYLFAAYVAAKMAQLPFSSYFHNTYAENRTGIHKWWAEIIQPLVFKGSAHVFVMSEGMAKFYNQHYNSAQFKPLTHSFSAWPDHSESKEWKEKPVWKLVLIGNFNNSNLDATKFLVNSLKGNAKYKISFCTKVPRAVLMSKGIDMSEVEHLGFVPEDQLFATLRAHDIAVVTHGFTGGLSDIEYQTIFPTRTIPLLLSGLPLLVLSPEVSFLSDFILSHNCAALVSRESADDLLSKLSSITDDKEAYDQLTARATETVQQFHVEEVIKSLRTYIG